VLEHKRKRTGEAETREKMARRQELQLDTVRSTDFLSFPFPGGKGEPRLGGELRREEERLSRDSRTGVCVDRDGTVDELC
jgi:hypothetical protein